MESSVRTRRAVARELGITYSTLRVYEKNLEGVLPRGQGANRTTLFDEAAVGILRTAIDLKRSGWPFSKLAEHFQPSLRSGLGDPEALLRIQARTEEILSLGHRIEARLVDMARVYRDLVGGEEGDGAGGPDGARATELGPDPVRGEEAP